MVDIESKRLQLRELNVADVTESYVSWLNNPEINQYLESRFFKHEFKDVKRFVEEINNDKYNILLGIFIKKSMKHIGNIKIGPINLHHKTAYIGLLIGDNSEWHNGYATESIQAVTKFCFNKLNLMKIVAGCYESNTGSKKAFEKSGYEVEGFLCSHVETDHGREGCWQLGKTA